jgi:hypothetical protein
MKCHGVNPDANNESMAAWKYLVTKIPFNVFNYFVVDVIWRLPV